MTRDQHIAILEFLNATLQGDLPPLDVEADAIIRAYLKKHPDAAYYLTMRAMKADTPPQISELVEAPAPRSWFSAFFERRETAVT